MYNIFMLLNALERQSHQMEELDKCRRDLENECMNTQQLREAIASMQVCFLASMTVCEFAEALDYNCRQATSNLQLPLNQEFSAHFSRLVFQKYFET